MSERLQVTLALLVFVGIGLAFYLERPEPPDSSLFGPEVALAQELAPLAVPGGELTLRGEVRASDGTSATEAFIALLRAEDDANEAEPLYHAYTDDGGRFALEGLLAGTYRVLLTHPSAPPKTFPLELPVAGDVLWELAEPLEPLPVLPEIVRTAIKGRVSMAAELVGVTHDGVALDGVPRDGLALDAERTLAGFEVVLRPAQDVPLLAAASVRRATTGAEGEFALAELVAARYDVEVLPAWARGGSWPVLARATFEAGAGAREGALELMLAAGALEGELKEAEGRPLTGALVKVSALDARDQDGQPQLWPPAVTDSSGRFRVALLPPGRYLVHLRAGSAARDVEVVVESGRLTRMPLTAMDPRAEPGG